MTPWTIACQAPLSLGFPRQEYWSGSSFPSPGDLPDPGIEPTSPVSHALAGRFFTTVQPGKPKSYKDKTKTKTQPPFWRATSKKKTQVLEAKPEY